LYKTILSYSVAVLDTVSLFNSIKRNFQLLSTVLFGHIEIEDSFQGTCHCSTLQQVVEIAEWIHSLMQ